MPTCNKRRMEGEEGEGAYTCIRKRGGFELWYVYAYVHVVQPYTYTY